MACDVVRAVFMDRKGRWGADKPWPVLVLPGQICWLMEMRLAETQLFVTALST